MQTPEPCMLYGLIGHPVAHSFSADFFNGMFEAEEIPARYDLYDLTDITELPGLISSKPTLRGLNVTIPYKKEVIQYLDGMGRDATEAGAVNVISILRKADGSISLYGDNSDIYGFTKAIEGYLKRLQLNQGTALVLGTGGAAAAAAVALRRLGFSVTAVSRTPSRNPLIHCGVEQVIGYHDITPEVMADCHVVVNATPLGLWPDTESCPSFSFELLRPLDLCFDMVYRPEVTEFMKRARRQKAVAAGGYEMLLHQAARAWEIWSARG